MKLLFIIFILSACVACNQLKHNNNPGDEHILIDIDEKTDTLSKYIYPSKITPHMITIKMFGVWNDTVILGNKLAPKDSVNNISRQEYYLGMPGINWSFRKYKATRYRIRFEVIFSEDYFEGSKDN
jgi:hypothetical protein